MFAGQFCCRRRALSQASTQLRAPRLRDTRRYAAAAGVCDGARGHAAWLAPRGGQHEAAAEEIKARGQTSGASTFSSD